MKNKKYTKKQIKKLCEGKCFFCEESKYELLDAHRILEGKDGGKYNWENMLILCANCHRKCHSGVIKILGSHNSTLGKRAIHYIEDGKDCWKF